MFGFPSYSYERYQNTREVPKKQDLMRKLSISAQNLYSISIIVSLSLCFIVRSALQITVFQVLRVLNLLQTQEVCESKDTIEKVLCVSANSHDPLILLRK